MGINIWSYAIHRDMAMMLRHTATTGLPIDAAISTMAHCMPHKQQKVLSNAAERISEGQDLHSALESTRRLEPYFLHCIALGEATHAIGPACEHLQAYYSGCHTRQHKISQALFYPACMLIGLVLLMVFFCLWALPKFVEFYTISDTPMPASTAWLLSLIEHWDIKQSLYLSLLITTGGTFCLWIDPFLKQQIPYLCEHLPLLKRIGRLSRSLRFALYAQWMSKNGYPIDKLLHTLNTHSSSPLSYLLYERLHKDCHAGIELSTALATSGYFEPFLVHMIRSGEQTGQLTPCLHYAADVLQEQHDAWMQWIETAIGPAMILLSGVLVGGALWMIYQPMLNLGSVI